MKRMTPRALLVLSLILTVLLILPVLFACSDDETEPETEPTPLLDVLSKTPSDTDDDEQKIYNAIQALELPGIGSDVIIESYCGDLLLLRDIEYCDGMCYGQRSVYDLSTKSVLYVAKGSAQSEDELWYVLPTIELHDDGLFTVREIVCEVEESRLYDESESESESESDYYRERAAEPRYDYGYETGTEFSTEPYYYLDVDLVLVDPDGNGYNYSYDVSYRGHGRTLRNVIEYLDENYLGYNGSCFRYGDLYRIGPWTGSWSAYSDWNGWISDIAYYSVTDGETIYLYRVSEPEYETETETEAETEYYYRLDVDLVLVDPDGIYHSYDFSYRGHGRTLRNVIEYLDENYLGYNGSCFRYGDLYRIGPWTGSWVAYNGWGDRISNIASYPVDDGETIYLYLVSESEYETETETEPATEPPIEGEPDMTERDDYEWNISGEFRYFLYNKKGEILLTSENRIEVWKSSSGDVAVTWVEADDVTYRFYPDTQKLGHPNGQSANLSSYPLEDGDDVEILSDGYLTQISDDSVRVFVKETGALAAYYAFPSYADKTTAYALGHGNVLLQYLVLVPQLDGIKIEDDEYDIEIVDDDEILKYTITTLLLSVETGEATEIEFPYLTEGVVTRYAEYASELSLEESVEALAVLYAIPEDKRINYADSAEIFATIDNDANLTELALVRDDQRGLPTLVYTDRFSVQVYGVSGYSRNYLYDGSGNLIGDITGSSLYKEWILSDTGVFDYNGDLLLDYAAENYTVLQANDAYILLAGTGKNVGALYLFTGSRSSLTTLAEAQDEAEVIWKANSVGCFTIHRETEDGSQVYELYSNGKRMGTFEHEPEVIHYADCGILLQVEQSNKTLYYLLSNGQNTGAVTEPEEITDDDTAASEEDLDVKRLRLRQAILDGTSLESLNPLNVDFSAMITPNQSYWVSVNWNSAETIRVVDRLSLKNETWTRYGGNKVVISGQLSSGRHIWLMRYNGELHILLEKAQ